MSEPDSSELLGDWDSELDDVDLCCSSPSSSAASAAGLDGAQALPAQQDAAGRQRPDGLQAFETAPLPAAADPGTSAASSTTPSLSSSFISKPNTNPRPAAARLTSSQGGPLFSLALADLNGANNSCSGTNGDSGNGVVALPLKQIARLHSVEHAAAAPADAGAGAASVAPALQQLGQKPPQQQPQQHRQLPLPQQLPHGVRHTGSQAPQMMLRLTSSTSSTPATTAAADAAACAAASAAATAALQPLNGRLPSPSTGARSSSSGSATAQDVSQSNGGGGGRRSRSSHQNLAPGFSSNSHNPGRGKPPPLALLNTAASSPGGSPHAFSAAAPARSGFALCSTAPGAAAAGAGWAGVGSMHDVGHGCRHNSSLEDHQQVKVQLLLPALQVYLPLQPEASAAGTSSSSCQQQSQQLANPLSLQHRQRSSYGKAQISGASTGTNTSNGGSSRGDAHGQQSTTPSGPVAAANDLASALQRAVSTALGVDPQHLSYYAVQQAQLPELLQQQHGTQQLMLPLPPLQQQQQQKLGRTSSSGNCSRPRSRGQSPLRGSSAGAGCSNGGKAAGEGFGSSAVQQELSVVVGFHDSCSFSLGKLEELLQGAAGEAAAAEQLQHVNKELQEELLRAKTRAAELSGDLARLQRAYDHTHQELCTHRVALSEARAELAAAGDSFVKLEAIHRANVNSSRSRSSSPRKGQRGSRGPPSARSQSQQQQQGLLAKAAAAAAVAAAEAAGEKQQQQGVGLQVPATPRGRAATPGSWTVDYADLIAMMARVSTPGFLNFIHQFLLIYEQQSGGSAADLAAVAAAMAGSAAHGSSPFISTAAATPRGSRSSSTGRGRTPRQHGRGGSSSSTPPAGLSGSTPGIAAAVAEVCGASGAGSTGGGGGSSGRKSARRKGGGMGGAAVPALRSVEGMNGFLAAATTAASGSGGQRHGQEVPQGPQHRHRS